MAPVIEPSFLPIYDLLLALPPMSERLMEARTSLDLSLFGEPPGLHEVRDITIALEGRAILARLYKPSDSPDGIIIHFHGGGWVFGGLETHDIPLRHFARMTGAAVLAVDYRLAPEEPFPAPFEDCYEATVWAAARRSDLAGSSVPLLIGGDSAGGNLAAAVAIAARDRGGPALAGQLLIYPPLFEACDKPSFEEHAGCGLLLADDMRWYWRSYVPLEEQRSSAYASPGNAADLRNLPPAIIAVAEFDPLRDDARDYAMRLQQAGNRVTVIEHSTMPHGFFNFVSIVPQARVEMEIIASNVRLLLAAA